MHLDGIAVERYLAIRASHGKTAVALEAARKPGQSHLQCRRHGLIAEQAIGQGHRQRIGRTAQGHAQVPAPRSRPGLNRRLQTCFDDPDAHRASISANVSASIATKRIRVPLCSTIGCA